MSNQKTIQIENMRGRLVGYVEVDDATPIQDNTYTVSWTVKRTYRALYSGEYHIRYAKHTVLPLTVKNGILVSQLKWRQVRRLMESGKVIAPIR